METKLIKSAACISLMVLVIICGAKKPTYAQQKKEIKRTIIINNSDTLVNGKNLKELSRSERKQLLKELEEMRGKQRIEINTEEKGDDQMRVIIRKQKDGEPEQVIVRKLRKPQVYQWNDAEGKVFAPDAMPMHFKFEADTLMFKLDGDSAFKQLHIRMKDLDSTMRNRFSFRSRDGEDVEFFVHPPAGPDAPMVPGMRMLEREEFLGSRKNSQSFSYSNIDKDGISNRMNIRLSDPSKEALGKITGSENAKATLDVQDLTIFPSFSTGKINLALSLKTKAAFEVKILDSSYQTIFSDKQVSQHEGYYKSLTLPKNGVYYVVLNQAGNWFVKKMLKE